MKSLTKNLMLLFANLLFLSLSTGVVAQITVNPSGDVGIGTAFPGSAKTRVWNNNNTRTLSLENVTNTNSSKYGLYNYVSSIGTGGRYGINNQVHQNAGSYSYLAGLSNSTFPRGGAFSDGIYNAISLDSTSTGSRYGIYNYIGNQGSGTRYGIYSYVSGDDAYAGYFVGDVHVSGNMTITSDERTKENVRGLNGAMNIVQQLQPVSYTYKKDMNFDLPSREQFGFLAQDVEQVLPDLVKTIQQPAERNHPKMEEGKEDMQTEVIEPETTELKAINYVGLIPILVEAIKEQQEEIEKLKKQVADR